MTVRNYYAGQNHCLNGDSSVVSATQEFFGARSTAAPVLE